MLEWNTFEISGNSQAKTKIAVLLVQIDWQYTKGNQLRFVGRITNHSLTELAFHDNHKTMKAAQDWCIAEYRRLLEQELALLKTAT